jgi:hypothetical protein
MFPAVFYFLAAGLWQKVSCLKIRSRVCMRMRIVIPIDSALPRGDGGRETMANTLRGRRRLVISLCWFPRCSWGFAHGEPRFVGNLRLSSHSPSHVSAHVRLRFEKRRA